MSTAKILAVDDEPDFEALLTQRFRRQIRDREFSFSFAQNGEEALRMLEADPEIELMLLDINMPVMDGLEFIKQLPGVANAKDVPVVMITTEGSESHVAQALTCGARGYIRKPFTAEQVKEHVVPVLAGKS